MLNVRQNGAPRQPALFSTSRHTTPSLCCRQNGATYYVPLVQSGASVTVGGTKRYSYSASKYPRLAFRYGGKTWYAVNRTEEYRTEYYNESLSQPGAYISVQSQRVFVSGWGNSYTQYSGVLVPYASSSGNHPSGFHTGYCEMYYPNGTLADTFTIPSEQTDTAFRSWKLYSTVYRKNDVSYDRKSFTFKVRVYGYYGNGSSNGQSRESSYSEASATSLPVPNTGGGNNSISTSSGLVTRPTATVTKSRQVWVEI